MASGRLTGTPKIHFRALKCKSNLALKCHSTDFSVCRTHENSADEGDGYGLWDMPGYTYIYRGACGHAHLMLKVSGIWRSVMNFHVLADKVAGCAIFYVFPSRNVSVHGNRAGYNL